MYKIREITYLNKKIKNIKTLKVKYRVIFVYKLKTIKNTIKFSYLSIFFNFLYSSF